MTAKEIVEKMNELFKICEEQNICVILKGEALSGDELTEAYASNKKIIEIW